ncbi:hypothetical protein CSAL01_06903 [Colletotrichum salicis]|uniref:Uncharacterized protein n=1 Tax=Colletotrichum salicis TaxID=1209931 RepID=A0A135UU25_9PEZI|nr:hypothetical protein CSAL01_06903 [Colletotrichum salicis]
MVIGASGQRSPSVPRTHFRPCTQTTDGIGLGFLALGGFRGASHARCKNSGPDVSDSSVAVLPSNPPCPPGFFPPSGCYAVGFPPDLEQNWGLWDSVGPPPPSVPPAAGWISSAEAGAVSVRQPPGTVASNGFEVHGLGCTASLTYFVLPAYLPHTPDLLSVYD